jgi:hypothetical protein
VPVIQTGLTGLVSWMMLAVLRSVASESQQQSQGLWPAQLPTKKNQRLQVRPLIMLGGLELELSLFLLLKDQGCSLGRDGPTRNWLQVLEAGSGDLEDMSSLCVSRGG